MKQRKMNKLFDLAGRNVERKLVTSLSALILCTGAVAQNSSYQANTIPLFGSGGQNAAFGIGVLGSLTSGSNNSGFGYYSSTSIQDGNDNTAMGRFSLFSNVRTSGNVAIGSSALYSSTGGGENVAVGYKSLFSNTDASYNTGVGAFALYTNSIGAENTATGYESLFNNTATGNSAIGYQSLYSNTSGTGNTALGHSSLFSNQTGGENTSIGRSSLHDNTGSNNTAIGSYALHHNTTGSENTASGKDALAANTTGEHNSAFGFGALLNVTFGKQNSAFGHGALNSLTGGANYNTAVGAKSLFSTTSANENTAVGIVAAYSNIDGWSNTAIGHMALHDNEHGESNTMVGSGAGKYHLDGNESSCFGANSETHGNTNSTALGAGAEVFVDDMVRIGSALVTTVEGPVSYSWPSDGRFKTNVSEADVKGIDFIRLLRPVVYNFDTRKFTEFVSEGRSAAEKARLLDQDFGASTAIRQSGFIAQEVEKAAQTVSYDFNGVIKPKDGKKYYSMAYSEFVVPLVKAVQEIDKQKTEQDLKIEKLERQLEAQQKLINELNQKNGNPTGIGSVSSEITGFSMSQNEPNPFTHETVVKYTLPASVNNAYMAVYDLSGKQITTLPIDQKGASSVIITSERLAAGIYIYSIVADGKVMDSKRMIIADK